MSAGQTSSAHGQPSPARTRLAVSIVHADVPLAEQVRRAHESGIDLVELRVDRIADLGAVRSLLAGRTLLPTILTVRPASEGGAWKGSESERLKRIEELTALNPGWVDVEWSAWRRSKQTRARLGALCNRLILSYHDFTRTPVDLDSVLDPLCAEPAALAKAAFLAKDARDVLRVLEQVRRRARQRPLICLAMGEAGLASRVLARKFGAFLTFAALEAGVESAPGQPTVQTLRDVYRWDELTPRTRVFGLIGWPVGHSLGPRLHNAAMRQENIDGVYLPFPVQPTRKALFAFLDSVAEADWLDAAGFSVTLPHKVHALQWVERRGDAISNRARRCGAVNTLIRAADGSWRGENTDVIGVLEALRSAPPLRREGLAGRSAAVLGAGGVARAVAAVLTDAGCDVTIYNRTERRAEGLARAFRCRWRPWSERLGLRSEILINCTRVGLAPDGGSPMPRKALRPGMIVFDTIYRPRETQLLRDAKTCGATRIFGTDLFLYQAAAQFQRWHARRPSLDLFRQSIGRSD